MSGLDAAAKVLEESGQRAVSASPKARRCDAPKRSLRSGDRPPFCRGRTLASERLSFTSHFHEFSAL
jgi:hypothetical protein